MPEIQEAVAFFGPKTQNSKGPGTVPPLSLGSGLGRRGWHCLSLPEFEQVSVDVPHIRRRIETTMGFSGRSQ